MTFHWSERAVAKASAMLRDGCTANEIGAALGTSRNSVIGKVRRHKELREIGFKGSPGGQPKEVILKARQQRAPASKRRKPHGAEHVPAVHVYRGAVSILDVGEFECRWPVGGEKAGMMCCGKPIDSDCVRKFCPEHFVMSCGEGTASERAAAPTRLLNPMKRRTA